MLNSSSIGAVSDLVGPRLMLPLIGVAVLVYWARKRLPWHRVALGAKKFGLCLLLCLIAYVVPVLALNYDELQRWQNTADLLLLRNGAPLGKEHALGGVLAACVAGFFVWRRFAVSPSAFKDSLTFLRGRRRITYEEALARAKATIVPGETTLLWGMLPVAEHDVVKNFLVVGSPGSGKTVSIQLLLRNVIPTIRSGSDKRILIYDAKSDMLPILASMNSAVTPVTLNPFDRRCVAWDMAKDIQFPKDASEIAHILVPDRKGDKENRFFTEYPRLLVRNVIISFLLNSHESWTFRDLLLALKSPGRMFAVLSRNHETESAVANLRDVRTRDNVMTSVEQIRSRYSTVAAIWDSFGADKSRWLSLDEWLRRPGILLLGEAVDEGNPTRELNQMILHRISELSDHLPKSAERRTWFVLDEIADFSHVPGLAVVLRRGREKGAAVVMGFQSWPAVLNAFGEEVARNLESFCGFRSFLGTNDDSTAEWAAKSLGVGEWEETRVDYSESYDGGKVNTSQSIKRQRVNLSAVTPDELKRIVIENASHGLDGFHTSSVIGDSYAAHVSGSWLGENLAKPDRGTQGLERRSDPKEQYLRDWSDQECRELKLPPLQDMDSGNSEGPDSISDEDVN